MAEDSDSLLPNELICSRCGMERAEWTGNKGRGVIESGEYYCCKGCAEDAGCSCDYDREETDDGETTKEAPPPVLDPSPTSTSRKKKR